MRANHPTRPATAATVRRDSGRPERGWLPRPRSVAAGGALLVQLWSLGLSATQAQAAALASGGGPDSVVTTARPNGPTTGTATGPATATGPTTAGRGTTATAPEPASRRTPRQDPGGAAPETSSGLVGELTAAVPALEDPATATAPVDHLLQDRIRAGGLPLPGQGKAVPDAFAIASVLQPSAPAAPHDGEPRASRDVGVEGADQAEPPGRSGGSGTSGRSEVSGLPALPVPAGTASPDALPVPPTTARSAADRAPAAVNAGTPLVPAQRRPPPAAGVRAEAAAPVAAAGTGAGAAVLVPIAAGLLLTGAAMYKHRGLPRGH
ncbi:hypothetical protein [Kitasatospora sp. NBC_00315]|uniref:hypothetical protein n=1 Tax=Kitasatospora sp. NBC_00315 TaxID=2975963 RepID=UPI003252B425